ncbi:MAG: M20/M25/M40 family metallo-hydrolase [Thermoanaerobaculales bacterium]|nr:M20/M25/M40 family metallo-hydrolase [Thermoanaerobaculales bacterium]
MITIQLAWVFLAAALGPATTFDVVEVSGRISAEAIQAHVEVLAGDAFEGRAPGTPGGEKAAAYIEGRLRAAGLAPILPRDSFRQPVHLHQSFPRSETVLELRLFGEGSPMVLGEDYLLHAWSPSSIIPRPVPVIFVGHGIVAPEFDHDDYGETDCRGAVVVYLAGRPPCLADRQCAVFSSPESKRRTAMARGVVGTILLPTVRGDAMAAWEGLQRIFALPGLELPRGVPQIPSFILHPGHTKGLFDEALFDWEAVQTMASDGTLRPFHLPLTLHFKGRFSHRDFASPNLLGLIKGSDAQLAREVVVVSAHYDHFGISPLEMDDRIYNGAVDNALGVAGVLEIARVLAELPRSPQRSILFLLTTAEEEGLLGARHFLADPPMPTSRMVAAVNVDGLAFLDTFDDVIAIGAEYSNLEDHLEKAVAPLKLHLGEASRELWLQEGFTRSDQLAFAEAGVPSVMISEGFDWHHVDPDEAAVMVLEWMMTRYHTPQDDVDQPMDFDAARLHARAVLALVLALADHPEAPQWTPGTRYAYERAVAQARRR